MSEYKRKKEARWFDHFRPITQTQHMRQQTGLMLQLSNKLDGLDRRIAGTEQRLQSSTAAGRLAAAEEQQQEQHEHEHNFSTIMQAAEAGSGMFPVPQLMHSAQSSFALSPVQAVCISSPDLRMPCRPFEIGVRACMCKCVRMFICARMHGCAW